MKERPKVNQDSDEEEIIDDAGYKDLPSVGVSYPCAHHKNIIFMCKVLL